MADSAVGKSIRGLGGLALIGAIALAFVLALQWAMNPEPQETEFFSVRSEPNAPLVDLDRIEEEEAEAEPDPGEEAEPEEGEPAEDEESGMSEEERQELIEAAPEPADTTVQVLDAGGGDDAMNAAADALREAGYNVVSVTSSRADVDATTAWFSEGHEDAAEGLRARDERIVAVGANERLNENLHVHVLVGPDWDQDTDENGEDEDVPDDWETEGGAESPPDEA